VFNSPVNFTDPSGMAPEWNKPFANFMHNIYQVLGKHPSPVEQDLRGEWGFYTIKTYYDEETGTLGAYFGSHFGNREKSGPSSEGELGNQLRRPRHYRLGEFNHSTGRMHGSGAVGTPLIDPIDILAGGLTGLLKGAGPIVAKGGSQLVAQGLGSTGRTAAANLTEQLAMQEIVSNPTLGRTVMTGMKDSRWLGWDKMQYTHTALDGSKTTIHYVGQFKNGILNAVDF
jgi:hypothetical protein